MVLVKDVYGQLLYNYIIICSYLYEEKWSNLAHCHKFTDQELYFKLFWLCDLSSLNWRSWGFGCGNDLSLCRGTMTWATLAHWSSPGLPGMLDFLLGDKSGVGVIDRPDQDSAKDLSDHDCDSKTQGRVFWHWWVVMYLPGQGLFLRRRCQGSAFEVSCSISRCLKTS